MPNSLGSTLIWRRSVTVRVSRGVTEPSGFFVCVADKGESIKRSSKGGQKTNAAFQYHCTPKGRPRKLAGRAGQSPQTETVMGPQGPGAQGSMCLLTIVVITSIMRL